MQRAKNLCLLRLSHRFSLSRPRSGIFDTQTSVPLAIPLSKTAGPLFRQIYLGLRDAILAGAFHGGDKLPSTRELADQLGVSRTVALLAYEQLLAEGFTEGRAGAGTFVAAAAGARRPEPPKHSANLRVSRFGTEAAEAWSRIIQPQRRARASRFDFAYGRSDLETFPFEAWRRILLRCARRASMSKLDYSPAVGNAALREAIAAHLRRSRAVVCDASQVIVVNGSQQALDLIARVLIERGDAAAIEDPGYQGTREVLRAAGARVLPVRVDHDGLDPARIPPSARIAF